MNLRQQSIQNQTSLLAIAETFLLKYDSKLPEDFNANLIFLSDSVALCIHCHDSDRDAFLTLMGDVFGRSDWNAELTYHRDGYDWKKTVDSVKLIIYNAQPDLTPKTFPVNPKAFPMQLA